MRVVAIIAAYNEADIIGTVVADLLEQGIGVYFLDDGSTDGTVAAVEPYVGRGVVAVERLRHPAVSDAAASPRVEPFDWERILRRKAQLARELDADWFIHHDADEFRESPWPHVRLADAIRIVDEMGYNAIDFASLNFWPIPGSDDRLEPGADVREALPYYSEHAPYDRVQIRCWKKADDVDLASSGGHEARFSGRKVFPLRFILRHYPVRGQAHGERKIFAERRARFRDEERARGWHIQYDDIVEGAQFVRDPEALREYDRDAVSVALALRHRGVEELESLLDDKRNALGEARSTIIRLHHELDAAKQELESRQLDLEAHKRDVALKRQELDRVAATLAKSQVEAASLHDQCGHQTVDLAELHAHLETRRAQVDGLEADLKRRADHIHALDAEIDGHTRTLRARDADIEMLTDILRLRDIEIRNWKRGYDDNVRRIHAFEESWSWRLTAPLRALFRVIARRRDS